MSGSSIWGPVLSGIVATGVVYLLSSAGRRPAKQVGSRRQLTYTNSFRIAAALFIPGSMFVAYAASQARPSQLLLASAIATVMAAAAAFLAYQAFFVRLEYDQTSIYYQSPLAGVHEILWSDVQKVGYSGLMQCHYIQTTQVRRIWCSNMLVGYEELGEFLNQRLGPPSDGG